MSPRDADSVRECGAVAARRRRNSYLDKRAAHDR